MALQIDREQLDIFCPKLFRTLDGLGLLPPQLWVKPNEFEKYPRLLFGSIQRYGDVKAGFKEWESRVLRDTPYHKEEHYLELEELFQWMLDNEEVFVKKVNLQHLRTSLYSRIFYYLYPRRVLANAYCMKHQGNPGAIESDYLAKEFPGSIEIEIQKLKEVYIDQWESIVADAKTNLITKSAYYRKVLHGKEPIVPPEGEEQAETDVFEEVSL